jgi:hypothetical protein
MTINKIISDSFDDPDIPNELKIIIKRFLEIEDSTMGYESKDKIYEQILKNSLDTLDNLKRVDLLKWCREYVKNG